MHPILLQWRETPFGTWLERVDRKSNPSIRQLTDSG